MSVTYRRLYTRKPALAAVSARRHYPRRTIHRRYHHRRRYGHHRRFPISHIRSRYVPKLQAMPDRELIRMKLQWTQTYTSGSATGIAPQTGCTDALYFRMNDIFAPGADGPFTGIRQPNGYTQESTRFLNYQVRGCRINVRIVRGITSTGSERDEMNWILVPLSSAQYTVFSAAVATTPFDQMKLVVGHSREAHQVLTSDGPTATHNTFVRAFNSPDKVQATPGFYTSSTSYAVFGASPSILPRFALIGSHVENFAAAQSFQMEVTIEYSVLCFGRQFPVLSIEQKTVPPRAELLEHFPMEEKDFDKIPQSTCERQVTASPLGGAATGTTGPTLKPSGWFS